jgi:hypothetical protein
MTIFFGIVLLLLGILFSALNTLSLFRPNGKFRIWDASNVVGTLWFLWVVLNGLTTGLWPLFLIVPGLLALLNFSSSTIRSVELLTLVVVVLPTCVRQLVFHRKLVVSWIRRMFR